MLSAFGDRNDALIADMVTRAAANPEEWWDRSEIGKLKRNETQPTLPLIRAISAAFPVTNPVFVACSRDEAIDLADVQRRHEQTRARIGEQRTIERKDVTAQMTAMIEGKLGPIELEELKSRAQANNTKRARRVLRGRRDRSKR